MADTIPPHIWAKRHQIDATLSATLRAIDTRHRATVSAHVKDALGPIQATARSQYIATLQEARRRARTEAAALFGEGRREARRRAKDAHVRAIDALWEEYRTTASGHTPGDAPGEGEGGRTTHATG